MFLAHQRQRLVSFSYHFASGVCRPLTFQILIFLSRITGSNCTKLGCDIPWMVLFQKLCAVTFPYIQDNSPGFWLVYIKIILEIFEIVLLQNYWMEWNQLWSKYSLGGGFPFKIVSVIIQDGHHNWLCNFWFSSIILSFWHPI